MEHPSVADLPVLNVAHLALDLEPRLGQVDWKGPCNKHGAARLWFERFNTSSGSNQTRPSLVSRTDTRLTAFRRHRSQPAENKRLPVGHFRRRCTAGDAAKPSEVQRVLLPFSCGSIRVFRRGRSGRNPPKRLSIIQEDLKTRSPARLPLLHGTTGFSVPAHCKSPSNRVSPWEESPASVPAHCTLPGNHVSPLEEEGRVDPRTCFLKRFMELIFCKTSTKWTPTNVTHAHAELLLRNIRKINLSCPTAVAAYQRTEGEKATHAIWGL